jgi:hypothetical protein
MLPLTCAHHRGVAFIAALALLCAQAIGLAHAVAHPHANGGFASSATHGHEHSAFDAQHDEGSRQCQLFDQLSHADGAAPLLQGWTFAAPVAAFATSPAVPVHATCARGYHARGPPVFLA